MLCLGRKFTHDPKHSRLWGVSLYEPSSVAKADSRARGQCVNKLSGRFVPADCEAFRVTSVMSLCRRANVDFRARFELQTSSGAAEGSVQEWVAPGMSSQAHGGAIAFAKIVVNVEVGQGRPVPEARGLNSGPGSDCTISKLPRLRSYPKLLPIYSAVVSYALTCFILKRSRFRSLTQIPSSLCMQSANTSV